MSRRILSTVPPSHGTADGGSHFWSNEGVIRVRPTKWWAPCVRVDVAVSLRAVFVLSVVVNFVANRVKQYFYR